MKARIQSDKEKIIQYENKLIMRTLKMACIVLAEEYGFGQQRIERFCCQMCNKGTYLIENPEQWVRIDEYLIDKCKLNAIFERENLDERESAARAIRKRYRL